MDVSMLDYQVRAHERAMKPPGFWDELPVQARRVLLASREGLALVNRSSVLAQRLQNLLYEGKEMDKTQEEVGIALELGEVLWHVSELTTLLGLNLPTVAKLYLAKRKAEEAPSSD